MILGFTEVGIAASAPFLGWIIDQGHQRHLQDPFVLMLFVSAGAAVSVAVFYGWRHHNTRDEEILSPPQINENTVPDIQTATGKPAAVQAEPPVSRDLPLSH